MIKKRRLAALPSDDRGQSCSSRPARRPRVAFVPESESALALVKGSAFHALIGLGGGDIAVP